MSGPLKICSENFKFAFAKNIQNHTKNSSENYADHTLWVLEELPGEIKNCKVADLTAAKIISFAMSALYVVPLIFYPKQTIALTGKSIAQIPFLPSWVAHLASLAVTITAVGFAGLKLYEYKEEKPYEKWEELKKTIFKQVGPQLTGFNMIGAALSSLYLLTLAFYPKRNLALTTKSALSILHPPAIFWKMSSFLISASAVTGYSLRAYGRFTNLELK